MNGNNKFIVSILGIIALYIITITTTVGITKEIGKTNEIIRRGVK